LSETFLTPRITEQDIMKKVHRSSSRETVIIDLIEAYFSRKIFDKTQIQNFAKLYPVGAKFFHADRWTDGQT